MPISLLVFWPAGLLNIRIKRLSTGVVNGKHLGDAEPNAEESPQMFPFASTSTMAIISIVWFYFSWCSNSFFHGRGHLLFCRFSLCRNVCCFKFVLFTCEKGKALSVSVMLLLTGKEFLHYSSAGMESPDSRLKNTEWMNELCEFPLMQQTFIGKLI